jgi:mannose-6-phosphate isomerase-like protein (cupin superfamily)
MFHPWHVDIESSSPDGGFVSAWLGLANCGRDASLRLIAGSHRFARPIQQVMAEREDRRRSVPTDEIVAWAQAEMAAARLAEPAVGDGEAVLFDGRCWHGSYNRGNNRRVALILQYARADVAVRSPQSGAYDWPFALRDEPRPPVIAISGRPSSTANTLAPAIPPLPSRIAQLDLPLSVGDEGKWQRFPCFRGATPILSSLSCHASALAPCHSPHRPHAHGDEELLLVLAGEAELIIADGPDDRVPRSVRLKAGGFVYYPAGQHHTIRNSTAEPLSYLMFRWSGVTPSSQVAVARPLIVRSPEAAPARGQTRFTTRRIFDARTRWLGKLHCHSSRLASGGGYAPHADPYDVAIIVQSGTVRTLGRAVGPGGVIFYPAGSIHGMRNVETEPAAYLVFEFHGPVRETRSAPPRLTRPLPVHPNRRSRGP